MTEHRAVLLEAIDPGARTVFKDAGFAVETFPGTTGPTELAEFAQQATVLGVRSDPKVTAEVLAQGHNVQAIGCYCVGVNQVDLPAATERGIPVFNSPYDNGRSVAEMVMANTIALLRGIPGHNTSMHDGIWSKSASGSHEVRGKTMGIIGFGNIGEQVGALSEVIGMQVVYYDVAERRPIGNTRPVGLDTLLVESDVITVHVSGGQAKPVVGTEEFGLMKRGVHFINASRADAVDYTALQDALDRGVVAGAALDVFPAEPGAKGQPFDSPFRGDPRVILTPHVGGSTVEAQVRTGHSVSQKLVTYIRTGSTDGAVNMPNVNPGPVPADTTRIAYFHQNQRGANAAFSGLLEQSGYNIAGEQLKTRGSVGYAVADIENGQSPAALRELQLALNGLDGAIRARILTSY